MFKHQDIIAKLDDNQKIRLLTGVGSLSGKDFKILGLDGVSVRNMKDFARELIPSYSALAHSWSRDVWYSTAKKRLALFDEEANFAIAPGAKIKLSPYRREISEDTYLASEFSASHIKAAKDSGFPVAASGYYLTEPELSWLDETPSKRVIGEMLISPYLRACEKSEPDAVITDERTLAGEYKRQLLSDSNVTSLGKWRITAKATEENTVFLISSGVICLEASQNALESAVTKYAKFMSAAERGESVTPEQIAQMQSESTIISPEAIDRAVDEVLDFLEFISSAKKTPESDGGIKTLAKNAVLKSAVLLKNKDRTLPLTKERSVAVIGNAFSDKSEKGGLAELAGALESKGFRCVGTAPGYDTEDDNAARAEAISLAKCASTIILILGFGYENEKRIQKTESLTLAANQLRLADTLVKLGKRVIGVIASGHSVDIEFTRDFKALMLMPLYVKSSPTALAELLSGEESPSGKLAYTLFAGSETAFKKRRLYKEKYGLISGPLVGYRYYTTANISVGYPFGHGLSYSSFRYSNLTVVDNETVRLAVQNTGSVKATETVQIYVGHKSSSVIRPKRELAGFSRVTLAVGERKIINVKLDFPKIYLDGKYVTERGNYVYSAGSSSVDIRLEAEHYVSGVSLSPDGHRLIDYIQSVTNITEDKFTLEANYGFMKRLIKNLIFGVAALLIAASLAIFNATAADGSLFLGLMAGIIALAGVAFFVTDYLEKNKLYEEERKRIDELNAAHFDGAEEIPMLSSDLLFKEEFDTAPDDTPEAVTEISDSDDELIRQYVEPDFRIKEAVADFAALAKDSGLKLADGVAERFVTSLATSSLIITDGLSSEDFNSFVMLAAEYFGSHAFVDKIELGEERQDMFFTSDEYGNNVKRQTLFALDAASLEKEKIFVAALDGADADTLKAYIKPFLAYISSPREENEIRIYNELGVNVGYGISKNLKLIVRLSDICTVDMLPASTLGAAAYNVVSFVKSPVPEESSIHHGCNRYQLDYILEKDGKAHRISEDNYKKLDKLEKYASQRSDFKIGNKQMIAFERQSCLLISAGCEVKEALDGTICARILPSVCSVTKDNLKEDDASLKDTLEFIYGEEDMPACRGFFSTLEEAKVTAADANARLSEIIAEREEAKRIAEEEAKRLAKEEAKRLAEEEAKRLAEEEAKRLAKEEAAALESESEENELSELEIKDAEDNNSELEINGVEDDEVSAENEINPPVNPISEESYIKPPEKRITLTPKASANKRIFTTGSKSIMPGRVSGSKSGLNKKPSNSDKK